MAGVKCKTMIEFDSKHWSVHDPDRILDIAAGQSHLSAALEPREDLMFFEHKSKPINIDFGFYGNEATLEGEWVVYVINRSFEEPWSQPLERIASNSLFEGIENIRSRLAKYT